MGGLIIVISLSGRVTLQKVILYSLGGDDDGI